MRGKGNAFINNKVKNRITPAYAGKSTGKRTSLGGTKDHPRLCGEKMYAAAPADLSSGSPPPMRGKAKQRSFSRVKDRITPAYAGKSKMPASA